MTKECNCNIIWDSFVLRLIECLRVLRVNGKTMANYNTIRIWSSWCSVPVLKPPKVCRIMENQKWEVGVLGFFGPPKYVEFGFWWILTMIGLSVVWFRVWIQGLRVWGVEASRPLQILWSWILCRSIIEDTSRGSNAPY